MNKSTVSGIIGCVAGAAIAGIAIWAYFDGGSGSNGDGTPAPMQPIVRPSIQPTAVVRLPETNTKRTNKGRFIICGRGEDADWGVGKEANFQYTADVIASSEILSKDTLPGGRIKVIEKRTFVNVQDSMIVSDVDFKLRLDTIRIKFLSRAIDAAAGLWAALTGDMASPATVKMTKDFATKQLEKVDGKGIRDLLGYTGLDVSPEIESAVNRLAGRDVARALGNVRKLSGKSYLITYYQEADAQPLHVTFKNEDGSDVTDEEEWLVLRRVNAFLDYSLVPDKGVRPGDSWKVDAEEFQEIFDPFVDGDYRGTVTLKRDADNEVGDWVVSAAPSEIKVVSAGNKTTGALQLAAGRAEFDAKNVTLKNIAVNGDANLSKVNEHHFLFTARISGVCSFEGRLIVDEAGE